MRLPRKAILALGIVVLVAALAGVALVLFIDSCPTFEERPGVAVRHDDFTFTVLDVRRTDDGLGGEGTATVRVRVKNEARRVNYDWDPSIAFVTDSRGGRHLPDRARSTPAVTLAPGQSIVATLFFTLPAHDRHAMLGYWDGVLMGDVFDG